MAVGLVFYLYFLNRDLDLKELTKWTVDLPLCVTTTMGAASFTASIPLIDLIQQNKHYSYYP